MANIGAMGLCGLAGLAGIGYQRYQKYQQVVAKNPNKQIGFLDNLGGYSDHENKMNIARAAATGLGTVASFFNPAFGALLGLGGNAATILHEKQQQAQNTNGTNGGAPAKGTTEVDDTKQEEVKTKTDEEKANEVVGLFEDIAALPKKDKRSLRKKWSQKLRNTFYMRGKEHYEKIHIFLKSAIKMK